MNTNHQTAIQQRKVNITAASFIRWAGLSAMAAGILFIVMQMVYPPQLLSSITIDAWAIVHYLAFVMREVTLGSLSGLGPLSGLLYLLGGLLFGIGAFRAGIRSR
jgi:hypothetical protein